MWCAFDCLENRPTINLIWCKPWFVSLLWLVIRQRYFHPHTSTTGSRCMDDAGHCKFREWVVVFWCVVASFRLCRSYTHLVGRFLSLLLFEYLCLLLEVWHFQSDWQGVVLIYLSAWPIWTLLLALCCVIRDNMLARPWLLSFFVHLSSVYQFTSFNQGECYSYFQNRCISLGYHCFVLDFAVCLSDTLLISLVVW